MAQDASARRAYALRWHASHGEGCFAAFAPSTCHAKAADHANCTHIAVLAHIACPVNIALPADVARPAHFARFARAAPFANVALVANIASARAVNSTSRSATCGSLRESGRAVREHGRVGITSRSSARRPSLLTFDRRTPLHVRPSPPPLPRAHASPTLTRTQLHR